MIESKDAVSALAAIVGAVAAGELTPAEAAELSKVVDGYRSGAARVSAMLV